MLRMSTLLLRTLRDDPADAEVASHKLLVRAGFVRRVAAGIYSWLPLGYRTYRKIENIIRQEMDAAGFQEVHFPALLPKDPYEATNRWAEYGPDLFRLQDRKKNDYLLGPTHEEMFTLMVKGEFSSYKDLPLSIYQIQTKFRDEPRPRSGIIRGREFVMKDSYSFDVDDAGLEVSYQKHRDAYIKTFDRLGLKYNIVSAVSGAMGGSKSEEFLAPCPTGEDTYVLCNSCGYAANVEAMVTKVDTFTGEKVGALEVLDTPNTPTIDSLVELFNTKYSANISAANTLKNVLIMADEKPISVLVPGDREVDLKRLGANLSGVKDLRLFEDADFAKYPKLVKGYVGPQDAKELGLKLYADPRVVEGSHWITGANKKDKHAKNVTCGRDFKVEQYVEAAEVKAGDNCPKCAKPVIIDRAIEIGHIFQLGQKYAKSLGLSVLDKEGKPVVVTMGSYGIGVSRAVAAIAEQTYDELGLCWPAEIAPADVHIVATGKEDKPFEVAEQIAKDLEAKGLEVLLDDRREASAGVKFKDAELIGISKIIIVGKSLADGKVEVRDRKSADKQEVVLADVVKHLVK
ncbi:MAG: proline--tRNA ligase [Actinobacteria bacterium BACL4 MAG-120820-bin23]|jgi:prolyl-tRNA synthetase|uniref:Proline--tRNA ligase n=1 Tax=freshwater metagenome TaxID=449393 RepID=A0A6J7QDB4_9ZZZZ|nr:MAG: proline--tRNA ligase [Actinobacteria bacterium BACL4 MAG-121022-bin9]KRO45691.1 MAG: proline--tRNA ligase [Actinobacteria bacterium BACL4 MAG-120813-bin39]KRO50777.1 MAG: proline--tRNA ligase [Actinobacteria bacterium BACL4 MAG-120820-bin23]KRO51416.1 MAG: proline--tRNA ligase [Actinobacteria bacterium BACL4 MAG-121001-bin59]KRO76892.1 MAG: proline--tRNA ligase [Actinobacteria bacterium BACL4 MAG-120920-bin74]KRO92997.1 MAG: proline--tRNA ligase [Actinobacteria bacterium BACL4 MAG-1205